VRRAQFKEE
jgi:hypothetical protein